MSQDWIPAAQRSQITPDLLAQTNRVFGAVGVSVSTEKFTPSAEDKTEDLCANCHKLISGRVIRAMDKTWHSECFSCSQCNRSFDMNEEPYTVRHNNLTQIDEAWCRKCLDFKRREASENQYVEPQAASDAVRLSGGRVIAPAHKKQASGLSQPAQQVQPYSDEPGKEQWFKVSARTKAYIEAEPQQLAPELKNLNLHGKDAPLSICVKCNEPITSGTTVTTSQGDFHEACFNCALCALSIPVDASFILDKGLAWHKDCHLNANASRCTACAKPMVGKYMTLKDGSKYHKECFVCRNCSASLVPGFLMRGGVAVCGNCAKQIPQNGPYPWSGPIGGALPASPAATPAGAAPTTTPSATAGSATGKDCAQCLSPLPPDAKFCHLCGAVVPAPPPEPAQSAPASKACIGCGRPVTKRFCGACGTPAPP